MNKEWNEEEEWEEDSKSCQITFDSFTSFYLSMGVVTASVQKLFCQSHE